MWKETKVQYLYTRNDITLQTNIATKRHETELTSTKIW